MEYPITQLWDSRALYIYALLGGLIYSDEIEVMRAISQFINSSGSRTYCLDVLVKLEQEAKIAVIRANPGDEPKFPYSSRNESKLSKVQKFLMDNDSDVYVEVRAADTDWFRGAVESYLRVFQAGPLFVPTGNQPLLYTQQKAALLSKIGRPPARPGEVEGLQNSTYRPLESLLSMRVEGIIAIRFLRMKLYGKNGHDYIIRAGIKRLEAGEDVVDEIEAPNNAVAQVKIEGRHIYIGLYGEEPVQLPSLRTDSGKYTFMHYLQDHPQREIHIKAVRNLYNCEEYDNLTELVRRCGFNSQLKDIFFENLTKSTVKFVPTRPLTPREASEFMKLIADRQRPPKTAG